MDQRRDVGIAQPPRRLQTVRAVDQHMLAGNFAHMDRRRDPGVLGHQQQVGDLRVTDLPQPPLDGHLVQR